MRTSLIMASLAAFSASILAGTLSLSYAVSCEATLKPLYKCTATSENGGSVDYCVAADAFAPGDGRFRLFAAPNYLAYCTCEAKGNSPDVQFGAAPKDFFCSEDSTGTVSIGKFIGNKIKGQVVGARCNVPLRTAQRKEERL